jgi:hypothetical protein
MAQEFGLWRQLLSGIDFNGQPGAGKPLVPCIVPLKSFDYDGCSALTKIQSENAEVWSQLQHKGGLNLDVIFWISPSGQQHAKFTTKKQLTVAISVADQEYFRHIRNEEFWISGDSKGGPDRRFIVAPMRSPTTGEMAFAFAVPVNRPGAEPDIALAMNAVPLSLVDVVVPPDYGFAVIDTAGKVLFHSQQERSLQENFFDETDDRLRLAQLVAHGRSGEWQANYRGSPYLGFVQPVSRIANCPWSIVTFRAREPLLDFQARQQGGALGLVLIGIAIPCLVYSIYLIVQWFLAGAVHPMIVKAIWPDCQLDSVYRSARNYLIALFAISLGMVMVAAAADRRYFNTALLYFLLTPLLACLIPAICYWWRPKQGEKRDSHNDAGHGLWLQQMFWLLLCASVLPACGDALLAFRVEDANRLQDWLFHSVRDHQARINKLRTGFYSSALLDPPTRKALLDGLKNPALTGCPGPSAQPLFSYRVDPRQISMCRPASASVFTITGAAPIVRSFAEFAITALGSAFQSRHPSLFDQEERPEAGEQVFEPDGVLDQSPERLVYCVSGPDSENACASGAKKLSPDLTKSHFLALFPLLGVPFAFWFVLGKIVLRGSESTVEKTEGRWYDVGSMPVPFPQRLLYLSVPGEDVCNSLAPYFRATESSSYVIEPSSFQTGDAGSNAKDWADEQINQIQYQMRRSARLCVMVHGFDDFVCFGEPRTAIARLLDKLLFLPSGSPLIVLETCADPASTIEYCKEGRAGEYPGPTAQLYQFLSQFRVASSPAAPQPDVERSDLRCFYDPRRWKEYLVSETAPLGALQGIRRELEDLWSKENTVTEEVLIGSISQRARAFFETIWRRLSKAEKMLLVEIAEGYLPNPKAVDKISELARKRLLLFCPEPRVFSETFRRFLCEREHLVAVHKWERESRPGGWRSFREVAGFAAAMGVVFYALTQGRPVESLITVATSTGALFFPKLRGLLSQAHVPGSGGGAEKA